MVAVILLAILGAICYYYYGKLKKTHSYWKNKNVAQLNPHFFFGDAKDNILKKKSAAELHVEYYKKFKKMGVPYGGVYTMSRKSWVPIDPDVIKNVLTKDFHYFSAHNPKLGNNLSFNNLFHMDGEEWKDWRRKLTPTFTSGKMKMMFDTVLEKSNGLVKLVDQMITSGETEDIKKLLARFTTDVIGSCGFGIECNSIKSTDSEFFKQGQNVIVSNPPSALRLVLMFFGLARPFTASDMEKKKISLDKS